MWWKNCAESFLYGTLESISWLACVIIAWLPIAYVYQQKIHSIRDLLKEDLQDNFKDFQADGTDFVVSLKTLCSNCKKQICQQIKKCFKKGFETIKELPSRFSYHVNRCFITTKEPASRFFPHIQGCFAKVKAITLQWFSSLRKFLENAKDFILQFLQSFSSPEA